VTWLLLTLLTTSAAAAHYAHRGRWHDVSSALMSACLVGKAPYSLLAGRGSTWVMDSQQLPSEQRMWASCGRLLQAKQTDISQRVMPCQHCERCTASSRNNNDTGPTRAVGVGVLQHAPASTSNTDISQAYTHGAIRALKMCTASNSCKQKQQVRTLKQAQHLLPLSQWAIILRRRLHLLS
jgi:hypothetical protein